MRRFAGKFHTLIVSLVAAIVVQGAPAQDLEPSKVRESIERGVEYLLRSQNDDGSWSDFPTVHGGVTALVTLALLNSGVDPQDEAIQRALRNLREIRPEKTYVVSLQTMAYCEADPKRFAPDIARNAEWLEKQQNKQGPIAGSWGYPSGADNSNSQFAMLALDDAERAGATVSDNTWRLALDYWREQQNPDGSWGYTAGERNGTGSMTCAGIASVVIAISRLSEGDAKIDGTRVQCCADRQTDDAVERALEWLGRRFRVDSNPEGSGNLWTLYYLYGVERTGRLTARRFIGGHDWYREGTAALVRTQDSLSGFWKYPGHAEDQPQIATSLALLFLAKGRRPVLMAKLKHGPGDDWDRHRSDVANLTSYVETRWKRPLTWQIVDPMAASVDDLLQAPVLFFNGKERPEFTDDQVQRLRQYVDRGGFLFAEGCCGGKAFDDGFRALVKKAFPEPEYALRLLPPDHPIWRSEELINPQHMRPLWGIDIGCRTSVVYAPPPDELSCYWELSRPGRERRLPAEIRPLVQAANSLGCNVLAYATGRELKYKYEIPRAADEQLVRDAIERATLSIGKLKHTGQWDIAPGALRRLQTALAEQVGLRVSNDRRELSINDDTLFDYHVLFMHGRSEFRFSEAERQRLRSFVERGGLLLADAVCASPAFAESFRREMAETFPDHPLEKIPITDPLFTDQYGGFDLRRVTRRDPAATGDRGPLQANLREVEPVLEGVKIGERYGVIFSPFDLSCALENHASLDCQGYIPEDAARIGINVVLYSFYR